MNYSTLVSLLTPTTITNLQSTSRNPMRALTSIRYGFHGFLMCVLQSSIPKTQAKIKACHTVDTIISTKPTMHTALALHSNTRDFAFIIYMHN